MPAHPLSDEECAQVLAALEAADGNQTEAAKALGMNRGTFISRLQTAQARIRSPYPPGSYQIGGGIADREILRLKKENARLREEIKDAHEAAIEGDEVRRIIGNIVDTPENPPTWLTSVYGKKKGITPEVPVIMLGDWHVGEVVKKEQLNGVNEFNKEVLARRVENLFHATVELTSDYGPGVYPGAVFALVGDFISGGIHPELQKSDDLLPIPAAVMARDLLVGFLERALEQYKTLYVPVVCGNHGRNTLKPEAKDYVYKNFDYLIYQLLIRHFAGNKHVQFDFRPSNEVFFRVWSKRFYLQHGDMLGVRGGDGIIGAIGPIMRGEIKTRGYAASTVSDYDHALVGHWHQPLWLPRIFVSNTLKGYDEFAKNFLKAPFTEPSQSLFYVHPSGRITARWEIFVEPKKPPREASWVSGLDC